MVPALVRYMTPPFGMYTALSAQMAGTLRHAHSRLVEFAEEIGFMKGEATEKLLIEREYAALIEHENTVLERRWWFGCVEEGIIKWLWGSFGVCHLPSVIHRFHLSFSSWYCVRFPHSLRFLG